MQLHTEKLIAPVLREALLDHGIVPIERLSLRHVYSVQAVTECPMATDLSSAVPFA